MGLIGIVGGGVVGLCAGLDLLEAGHGVVLVDDDPRAQAPSWGNAGHVATEQVEPLASLESLRSVPGRLFTRGGPLAFPPGAIARWMPFGMRLLAASAPARFRAGCAAMRPLMAQALPAWQARVEAIGEPGLLRNDGHFVLWQDAAAAQAGQAAWEAADTGTATVRAATAPDLARLSALTTRPVAGAVHFSGTAQIADLGELRAALRAAFVRSGGTLVDEKAALVPDRDRKRIVRIAGRAPVLDAVDRVLVCAGIRSRALMEGLGHAVPMIAERGYHVRAKVEDGGWPADMPPVVFEERGMIVTRYRTCVQAASFVELGDPDAPADPRKWERLETHIAQLGLPVAGPFARWMGCRPTLPDYLPAIGRSARLDNLFYAFGHQHLGLTLAPITARLVADMIGDKAQANTLAPFDLARFA